MLSSPTTCIPASKSSTMVMCASKLTHDSSCHQALSRPGRHSRLHAQSYPLSNLIQPNICMHIPWPFGQAVYQVSFVTTTNCAAQNTLCSTCRVQLQQHIRSCDAALLPAHTPPTQQPIRRWDGFMLETLPLNTSNQLV